MSSSAENDVKKVPTYCFQYVAGPGQLQVRVENGVATVLEPNHCSKGVHPANSNVCIKAFRLMQKTYNPHRILTPMKWINPKKGRDEDPRFVPISWKEALDLIAEKLNKADDQGLLDESGYPRVAASFGGGGTPTPCMGTFSAFLASWGP